VLPHDNEPDLEELPKETKEALEFVLADSIDQVLEAAFDGRAPVLADRTAATERQAAMPA